MKIQQIISLLIYLYGSVALGQEIEVRKLDKGHVEFTLNADVMLEPTAAQLLLRPRIEQECGNLKATLGRYKFESTEPVNHNNNPEILPTFRFIQEAVCGSAQPTLADQREIGIQRDNPEQELEAFIEAISIEFFKNRSNGAFEDAYSALSKEMRSFSEFDEWKNQAQKFRQESGPIESATIWRTTVYKNPQGAPMPGIYIAADYEIEYENIPLQCGYLMWFELPKQKYVILREESGIISNEIISQIPENQLPQIKAQFGCAQ